MYKNIYNYKPILLGLGFDGDPKHRYFTKGDNFYIAGGSKSTHETMIDNVMRFNHILNKYGKNIDQLSREEYYRIVQEIGENTIRWGYFHP